MTNFSETELVPFALRIIKNHNDGIDTKNLILRLRHDMQPNGEDLEILKNRSDDKFSQKVRNLKSHRTLESEGYADFIENKFYISQGGLDFLSRLNQNYFFSILKKQNTTLSKEEILDLKISLNWELSVRATNTLNENKIFTIRDLLEWDERKFLSIPGFGRKSLNEIKNFLNYYKLKLGENISYIDTEIVNKDKKIIASNNKIEKKYNDDLDIYIKEKKFLNSKTISINILTEWPLSVRTFNALKQENIIFLGDLLSYDENSLLKLKNFGIKSLKEIHELYQRFNIDKDIHNYDLSNWENLRDQLIIDQKKHKINQNKKNLIGLNKSIFKDFKKFKEKFYETEKIIINENIESTELEKLILDDIEFIISLLTDRMVIFFTGRYGYKENYKTLDELGKKFSVTRERVRQLEKNLNFSLVKLGKIEKKSLVKFFDKYEYVSFHKLFPTLDKNFTDTARGTTEITRDKLVIFMEYFCGVDHEYFKTPERELWHFDTEKLSEIFTVIPSGISKDNFLEVVKENFGYNRFVSKSAIEFMIKKKLIKIHEEKIYPLKMRKNLEVTHILVSYPKGLHWRKIAEVGNKSFTSNNWDLSRIVGDSSLNMISNQNIYLCERGTYNLFIRCPEIKNKDEIINFFIKYLKENNVEQSPMEPVFKEIIKLPQFKDLNFYDARAIIKKFGNEEGLFHKGTSGTNTVSLNKKIKLVSLKDKIREIISSTSEEVNLKDIINKLQKTNEDIPVDLHLGDLVDNMEIFRISPGTFLNFEDGLKLCDKDDVNFVLDKLLDKYEFITNGFMREKINDELGFNLSNFYYDTLSRILAKENNWFYGSNYLSKKKEKVISVQEYIKEQYDDNLSKNENYENITKKIGISKMYFDNIVYQSINNFNTDWIHKDD